MQSQTLQTYSLFIRNALKTRIPDTLKPSPQIPPTQLCQLCRYFRCQNLGKHPLQTKPGEGVSHINEQRTSGTISGHFCHAFSFETSVSHLSLGVCSQRELTYMVGTSCSRLSCSDVFKPLKVKPRGLLWRMPEAVNPEPKTQSSGFRAARLTRVGPQQSGTFCPC